MIELSAENFAIAVLLGALVLLCCWIVFRPWGGEAK